MKIKTFSDKTIEVLVLLVITLGLMFFGFLNQCLDNYLSEGIYSDHIIQYWVWVLLISIAAAMAWKALSIFRRCYPYIYERIQMLILLVLLIFNIFVTVVEVLSDFAWNWHDFHHTEAYRYALQQAKFIGRTKDVATLLPKLFWRWENNAILPALSFGYGVGAVFLYLWIVLLWLFYSFWCMRHLRGEHWLNLCVNEETLLKLDLTRIVYLSALLPLLPLVIGQVLPLFGLTVFYGGIMFSTRDVAFLAVDISEAGILQLLTMVYLLYQPSTAVQEEHQVLPSDEETPAEAASTYPYSRLR